eukprot:13531958-Alexandrium_andersonii.AAC.1
MRSGRDWRGPLRGQAHLRRRDRGRLLPSKRCWGCLQKWRWRGRRHRCARWRRWRHRRVCLAGDDA